MLDPDRDATLSAEPTRTPTPIRFLEWLLGRRAADAGDTPRSVVTRPRSLPALSPSKAMVAAREGRKGPRVPFNVHCGITRAGGKAILPGRTLDLSRRGALLFSLAPIANDEIVHHLLRFKGDEQPSRVPGRVVWCRPHANGFQFGVEYQDVPGEIATRVGRWVEDRWGDVRQLQFLLALGRLKPEQQRQLEEHAARLGAPTEVRALRAWLIRVAGVKRPR